MVNAKTYSISLTLEFYESVQKESIEQTVSGKVSPTDVRLFVFVAFSDKATITLLDVEIAMMIKICASM